MLRTSSIARAVRRGNSETAVPRFLAMLCILAVFIPSAFMEGSARALFAPMSLAVGFAMIASYILSSTFVPILSVWLLRHTDQGHASVAASSMQTLRKYGHLLMTIVRLRRLVVPVFLGVAGLIVVIVGRQVGTEIFPQTDKGQFTVRLRAPTGTTIERTEELAQEALRFIKKEVGEENVDLTVGYVGMFPANYPIQAIYQWTSGSEEVSLKVALRPGSGIRIAELKHRLREKLPDHLRNWLQKTWTDEGLSTKQIAERLPGLRHSFEPADIINEVMSFGSPTPVDVAISGVRMENGRLTTESEAYIQKVREELTKITSLRDLQIVQAMDYPALEVRINRQEAGIAGVTALDVTRSLLISTASSRFVGRTSGTTEAPVESYMVQVQVSIRKMNSVEQIEMIPVKGRAYPHGNGNGNGNGMTGGMSATAAKDILLRDVAVVRERVIPGEIDRYNMRRTISFVANIEGEDMGRVDRKVRSDRGSRLGSRGVTVRIRGQLAPMEQIFNGLTFGLIASVVVIFLLLTAYFQSLRLALFRWQRFPQRWQVWP